MIIIEYEENNQVWLVNFLWCKS